MEYSEQQNNKNDSEKPNTVYIKKKTNTQILPPMGMVFVFCTLMLIGRTVKQNFCPGYSALISKEPEPATNEVSKQEQHDLKEEDVCLKNTQISEANRAVCEKQDLPYQESTSLDVEQAPKKTQKLTLEQIEKLNAGNLLNKQRTSEPIIYLFVFIFIYLLLKSIADINAYYKKKMSGDNNMRRCSLQSYAQIHRYEQRRASRVTQQTPETLEDLEHMKQHVNLNTVALLKRRSSLPAMQAPYYRPPKLANTGGSLSLRRDSGINHPFALESTGRQSSAEGLGNLEVKRRVRMINRH